MSLSNTECLCFAAGKMFVLRWDQINNSRDDKISNDTINLCGFAFPIYIFRYIFMRKHYINWTKVSCGRVTSQMARINTQVLEEGLLIDRPNGLGLRCARCRTVGCNYLTRQQRKQPDPPIAGSVSLVGVVFFYTKTGRGVMSKYTKLSHRRQLIAKRWYGDFANRCEAALANVRLLVSCN